MNSKNRKIGPLEARILSWIQIEKVRLVRTGDLVKVFDFTPRQENTLLYRMNKSGLIAKVMRGFYLVPNILPVGDKWIPNAALSLYEYMKVKKASYQITGPEIFRRYGFSKQVTQIMFVYNDKVSGAKTIAGSRFIFIKMSKKRLGFVYKVPLTDQNGEICYGTKARAVFDAIFDVKRFATLPDAYEWIIQNKKERGFINDLATITARIGNMATKRRIGFVLQRLGCNSKYWKIIEKKITKSKRPIQLVPGRIWAGKTDSRWGIKENDDILSSK